MYKAEFFDEIDEIRKLIKPTGYHILIAMPQVEEKTRGGVYIPDELKDRERVASIVGYVVALGPDAYADKKRFPQGPWCSPGDWVTFRAYSGTKIRLGSGTEVRLINDDTVDGVVADPQKIARL